MKINGKTPGGPATDVLVIPRPAKIEMIDGVEQTISQDIVFEAQAVLDFDEFLAIYPEPEPPMTQKPGGEAFKNFKHPDYLTNMNKWQAARMHWMILKALEVTEGLEWDTVEIGDPTTWGNWAKDLKNSGFNIVEIAKIQDFAITISTVNETRMNEARERFLADRRLAQKK